MYENMQNFASYPLERTSNSMMRNIDMSTEIQILLTNRVRQLSLLALIRIRVGCSKSVRENIYKYTLIVTSIQRL